LKFINTFTKKSVLLLSKDFLRTIFLSNINIIYPEESDIKAALKTLVNYQSTELTFSQSLRAVLGKQTRRYTSLYF